MVDDHASTPRQAVLLAAGEGSRLRPLTDLVPKPMLPIGGEAVVARVLRQVVDAGVRRVVVVVGYRGDVLRSFIESLDVGDVDVAFVDQPERRGSADALQCALRAGLALEDTIVAGSDTWWRDEDVRDLVHRAAGDDRVLVTMGLLRWPVGQLPHGFQVQVDDDLRVRRVLDRVDPGSLPADATALAGSPIYVFRGDFWPRVAAVEPGPSGIMELAGAIQGAVDDGRVVRGHEVHGALDLTRPVDLLRHNVPYLRPWLDEANAPS